MTEEQPSLSESQFGQALQRYQDGAEADDVIADFEVITRRDPRQAAGWTCLAWLQLLTEQPEEALRSAKTAVKLNAQDPQGLWLMMLYFALLKKLQLIMAIERRQIII